MFNTCLILIFYFLLNSLDELLKGGLYPGQLCEICGLSASGKTQLCFTIAANAVAKLNIITWYLDTKRDFSRVRFEEILRARNFTQTVTELNNKLKTISI